MLYYLSVIVCKFFFRGIHTFFINFIKMTTIQVEFGIERPPRLKQKSKIHNNNSSNDKNSDYYDDLESELLGEGGSNNSGGLGGNNTNISKKINLSNRVSNEINKSEKSASKRVNYYGRDDRATSEQVLDPRTRLILFKLLNSTFLGEIDGCLSTGKEANVYYATSGRNDDNLEYAVKIFKTSILVFKDRDRYVSGEYRFRNGYCKTNPRKMVKLWAEKEMRNLKRLYVMGLPCPEPYLLKSHVLIMRFIGINGWCAPRLKDAELTNKQMNDCYLRICVIMKRMYHECNLVHGDLSEYNILWHNSEPYVIDVSQSVEKAHPSATSFLRKDIANITLFFRQYGVECLDVMPLYSYISSDYDFKHKRSTIDTVSMYSESSINTDIDTDNDNDNDLNIDVEIQLKDQIQTEKDKEKETQKRKYFTEIEQRLEAELITRIASEAAALKETEERAQTQALAENIATGLTLNNNTTTSSCTTNTNNVSFADNEVISQQPLSLSERVQRVKEAMRAVEAEKEVQEGVFMEAHIPRSLHEFSNPVREMQKLKTGQRETIFTDAVQNLLGGSTISTNDNKVEGNKVVAPRRVFASDNMPHDDDDDDDEDEGGRSDEDDSDEGNDDDNDADDDVEWEERDSKNRSRLPDNSRPEERQAAKDTKRQLAKQQKAEAAEKRKNKIKKHVKKRAVKSGKKK